MKCKGCGSEFSANKNTVKLVGRKVNGLYRCPECGALQGECYLGDFRMFVKSEWETEEAPEWAWTYYDVVTIGSKVERRHGWYDSRTCRILQVG